MFLFGISLQESNKSVNLKMHSEILQRNICLQKYYRIISRFLDPVLIKAGRDEKTEGSKYFHICQET